MRIAFIGGTRFIGAAAVRRALSRDHEVFVLHRGEHPNPNDGAQVVPVDRTDSAALAAALAKASADVVVDTRAMTEADARVTLDSSDAPICVLSSQDVYAQFGALMDHPAPPPEDLITEDSPLTVPFPYRGVEGQHGHVDYDKKLVEAALRAGVLAERIASAIVLRLPATYGIGDPARRFGGLVDALDAGDGTLPHQGGARWRWTRAHVDDVAVAIVGACEAISERAGFHVYNVGEPTAWPMSEWAERLAACLGKSVSWSETAELPESLGHLGIMGNDVVVTSRKIRAELGYEEITSVERRLEDIVAWARQTRAS